MVTRLESNKTKIAKRVIEVFEFFDNNNRNASVMDIVREYGRPQSSTSELLQSLAEMGLLYKDARTRTYSPTPRLATLGSRAQPEVIRNGHLYAFMDRLAHSSRHSVALFGMVGIHAQIFRWVPGAHPLGETVVSGAAERLAGSAAGQLLLSTLPYDAAGRLLRRLNAEAAEGEKFNTAEMNERIAEYRLRRHAVGKAGFDLGMEMTAVLLPMVDKEQPLALAVIYPGDSAVDSGALLATLKGGIAQCMGEQPDAPPAAPSMMRAI